MTRFGSSGLPLPGTTGVVDSTEGGIHDVGIINDSGGSSELPPGRYRVEVTRAWGDYEIGGRAEGELLDAADVEIAREAAKTDYPMRERESTGDPVLDAHTKRIMGPGRERRVFFALRDFEAD